MLFKDHRLGSEDHAKNHVKSSLLSYLGDRGGGIARRSCARDKVFRGNQAWSGRSCEVSPPNQKVL